MRRQTQITIISSIILLLSIIWIITLFDVVVYQDDRPIGVVVTIISFIAGIFALLDLTTTAFKYWTKHRRTYK